MSKIQIDLDKFYSKEINNIMNMLNHLENGRIYEKTDNRSDGYLATNIAELRHEISYLLEEIKFGKTTSYDEMQSIFKLKKEIES
ncbi:hypothetical protein [Oceanobacillus kimchii]|uniref:hypothetical protein n=1 Tax=Oceanobacillus kimchii TaxID=746691 RepID=UPI003C77756B